ncbi:MAG: phosphoribosyl-AMP cyclohydrolase [Leptospiraceae bacterium]|nr:phosphoribosyl-AMP cyclohydrolase [Leptospiraceae bacterium]MCB1321305.1 phosphoribosyl-AMP cyclohydrolase [Leptospiraceae bacterium]
MKNHTDLEEDNRLLLDYSKLQQIAAQDLAVVPVAVQHADSGQMLLIAYVNREALEASLQRRIAVFWSTSRNALWVKGDTSGDYLDLVDAFVNCEQNSLLFLVRPRQGGVCHTRDATGATRRSCYYRRLKSPSELEAAYPP